MREYDRARLPTLIFASRYPSDAMSSPTLGVALGDRVYAITA